MNAQRMPGDPPSVSVVRLQRDQWLVTNTDDATIAHHADWLPDVLGAHRHAVAFRLHRDVTFRYVLGGDDTADRIARIRTAGEHVAALRRQATHAEALIRADRNTLVRDLAQLRVAPGEIAQILGIPTTAIPKDLGTDRDARLARTLYTRGHTNPLDTGATDRLF